ncbi:MAG TPA: CehA/McbA family metallohydrolase [Polyangiaceae bacterium]|jgi:MYXO-CTERM domain-containing protein|nr:CehA/McbA family metallohydrolase [Polyangiaceae bacterium]
MSLHRIRGATVFGIALTFAANAHADTTQHIEGDVPQDGPEHFYVPFTVPDGTVEIEVAHTDNSDQNILDWGVYDQTGAWRGYGGGNTEDAIIGVAASSRSYMIGPINAGTWNVDIGKAKILTWPEHYTIDVTYRTAATLAPQTQRTPYTPRAAVKTGARWYAGDFHSHSKESGDAKPEIADMITLAKSLGLDFIELSDHNTVSQLDFYAANQDPDILLVPGVEFTTYHGHANGIGATQWVDHKIGLNGATIDAAITAFHGQGALFSINHPAMNIGDLCIGCAWDWPIDPSVIDGVEIETGGYQEAGVLFHSPAMTIWEQVLTSGKHAFAMGGSDDHQGGKGSGAQYSPIASPTTLVYATELSVAGLLEGLREGRTVVKLQSPADPMIDFDVDGRTTSDTVAAHHTRLHATITGGVGQTFHFVKNGVELQDITVTSDPFMTELDVDAPATGEDRYRAEVWNDTRPSTITSHVFVTDGAESFGGGCAVAPTGDDPKRVMMMLGVGLAIVIAIRRRVTR